MKADAELPPERAVRSDEVKGDRASGWLVIVIFSAERRLEIFFSRRWRRGQREQVDEDHEDGSEAVHLHEAQELARRIESQLSDEHY